MRKVRGNRISMIFQEPMTSLNPVLTLGFQIAEALVYHRDLDRARAQAETLRMLEHVRIPSARSRLHDYPHRLSGGMRQRVMIAMALACRPKLLIADEPTTALDVTIQAEILELIKLLQDEEGMSVVFITHDMGVVAEIADRTVVMLQRQRRRAGADRAALRIAARAVHARAACRSSAPGFHERAARPATFRHRRSSHRRTRDSVPDTPSTAAVTERPVLEVANLVTRFDIRSGVLGRVHARVHAVENVSFSLRAGETLALVGESGCGKSTTATLDPATRRTEFGNGAVRGAGCAGARSGRLARGTLPHADDLPGSIREPQPAQDGRRGDCRADGGAWTCQSRRCARPGCTSSSKKVGLPPDMASRFPHEFSGGQRQRLCIARALALQPRLLVADEAVSALDVSIKAQVINLMMDLQAEMGLAYLFISHDIAVVERVSHRVAVMYLGEIVEIGPRAAIIENPQHPYTKRLLAAVPVPEAGRRALRRGLSTTEVPSPIHEPLTYARHASIVKSARSRRTGVRRAVKRSLGVCRRLGTQPLHETAMKRAGDPRGSSSSAI